MKRKRRAWKQGLSFLLVIVLFIGILQLSVVAVEDAMEEPIEITFNVNGELSADKVSEIVAEQNPDGSKFKAVISENVTSIGDNAFLLRLGLERITLPDSMSSIGNNAFYGCNELTEIKIPESVTKIGWGAFGGCSSLTAITIPNGVTEIQNAMFEDCRSLTSVTFSENVTSIGSRVFWGCSSLESITLSDGITRIEEATFEGCSSLTNIKIPENVNSIGLGAFRGCSGLTDIVLPGSVISIVAGAFMDCANLKSLDMSACTGLTSIPTNVAPNCGNLTTVLLGGNALTFEGFETSASSVEITFPANATVTLQSSVKVTKGQTYIIPEGTTCVVPSGGTFTNNGKIENHGTLKPLGTFQNKGTLEGVGTADPLLPIEITASLKSVTYNSADIEIAKIELFSIPKEAGAVTYTLVSDGTGVGEGTGTLNDGLLTVTKAGTFTIRVSTAETDMYNAGTAEAVLTVEKLTPSEADLTYVIPTSVVYTGVELPVTITKNNELLGTITVTYTNNATHTVLTGAPVDVGSYLVTAAIEESDFYKAATLTLGSYSITQAPLKITAKDLPPAKVGDPIPSFPEKLAQKVTAVGLVGGDNLEEITVEITDVNMNTAGEYDIVPTNAVIKNNGADKTGNYTITYENGTLKVTDVATGGGNSGNTGGGNNNGENNNGSGNDSSSGDTSTPTSEKTAEQPKAELPILKPSRQTSRKTDKNQGLVYVEDNKDSEKQTDNATITGDTEAETTAALVSNNTLWISIAVIVILALGGIAAYIYFMSQKRNEE